MSTPIPTYQLVDRDLLKRLMQRTGTGAPISIRALAKAANVPHGTIGNLLSGEQEGTAPDSAHRIAAVLGVAMLILWIPPSSPAEQPQPLAVVPEQVSA